MYVTHSNVYFSNVYFSILKKKKRSELQWFQDDFPEQRPHSYNNYSPQLNVRYTMTKWG